jgi:uncharacterized protein
MKLSARGHKKAPLKKCLIVDGYNIIPRLLKQSLNRVDLESARKDLIERLVEYRSFSGEIVIVVFDAYQTNEPGIRTTQNDVEIYYTLKNETADDCIERLVYQLRDIYPEITVATSDYAEQQVTFGGGALRISADDLVARLAVVNDKIHQTLKSQGNTEKAQIRDVIRQDVANILEKWRRQ